MADKNIQMHDRNADDTGWDKIYPITLSTNVLIIDPDSGKKLVLAVRNGLLGTLEVA